MCLIHTASQRTAGDCVAAVEKERGKAKKARIEKQHEKRNKATSNQQAKGSGRSSAVEGKGSKAQETYRRRLCSAGGSPQAGQRSKRGERKGTTGRRTLSESRYGCKEAVRKTACDTPGSDAACALKGGEEAAA